MRIGMRKAVVVKQKKDFWHVPRPPMGCGTRCRETFPPV